MLNVILAVNDKKIEKFILSRNDVNVLTIIKKRDEVINRTIDLNPHAIVISRLLAGSLDFKVLISKLHQLNPDLRIVFLYGNEDNESRTFADFLINIGVYNFIIGLIDAVSLPDVLTRKYTLEDVEGYLITKDNNDEPNNDGITPIDNDNSSEQKESDVQAIDSPAQDENVVLDFLIVEKIIEKHIVETKHIGTYEIAVGSLFAHSGCTHLCFEISRYLQSKNINVGMIINNKVYQSLKENCEYDDGTSLRIDGITLYTDNFKAIAVNKHNVIVIDLGKVADGERFSFNLPILINPLSLWEQDTVLNFISMNPDITKIIKWIFYPSPDNLFNLLYKNMLSIGCTIYKNDKSVQWSKPCEVNEKNYDSILYDVVQQFHKEKLSDKHGLLHILRYSISNRGGGGNS